MEREGTALSLGGVTQLGRGLGEAVLRVWTRVDPKLKLGYVEFEMVLCLPESSRYTL